MEPVKLADSFTVFYYAFRTPLNFYHDLIQSLIWTRSRIGPDPSYLFTHVQDFFARNMQITNDKVDPNEALIFELKTDPKDDKEKEKLFLYNNFFRRNHQIETGDKTIEFSFTRDKAVLSPKLYIVPLTGIGILTFGLKLAESSNNLPNLLDLNYHIRVFSSGQVQTIKTIRNTHPRALEQEKRIEERLSKIPDTWISETDFQWNIRIFIGYLLSGFEEQLITLSPARLQAFTYVNLKDDLQGAEIDHALFRLRRIYSENYIPARKFLETNDETNQTFDKIYYGATVEGATVLVRPDERPFFKNYAQTVIQRTLWTYILAYHQRYALIAAASDTSALYRENREPATSELSDLVDRISKVQLKCMFEEISHYTQQNDFYYLCYHNLRIAPIFREVKEEIEEINKLLTERWREQEEVRRRYEEKVTQRNQRMLEILLALLIIPQIWFAVLSTNLTAWQRFLDNHLLIVNLVNGGIWMVILIIVVRLFILKRK
jgi:hypothetical protein